jgi:hypothetical protein
LSKQKEQERTQIKIISSKLVQGALEGTFGVSKVGLLKLGGEEEIFPLYTRGLDANTNFGLVTIGGGSIDELVAIPEGKLDSPLNDTVLGFPGPYCIEADKMRKGCQISNAMEWREKDVPSPRIGILAPVLRVKYSGMGILRWEMTVVRIQEAGYQLRMQLGTCAIYGWPTFNGRPRGLNCPGLQRLAEACPGRPRTAPHILGQVQARPICR